MLGFDEVDHSFTLPYLIGLYTVIVLAAYAYMRSRKMWQRILALAAGIVIPAVGASIGSTLYWQENGWVSVPGMVAMGLGIVIFMFGPTFIGIVRYGDNPVPPEWGI